MLALFPTRKIHVDKVHICAKFNAFLMMTGVSMSVCRKEVLAGVFSLTATNRI
jgi:hypothetical protein